jgi:hypothetical protein
MATTPTLLSPYVEQHRAFVWMVRRAISRRAPSLQQMLADAIGPFFVTAHKQASRSETGRSAVVRDADGVMIKTVRGRQLRRPYFSRSGCRASFCASSSSNRTTMPSRVCGSVNRPCRYWRRSSRLSISKHLSHIVVPHVGQSFLVGALRRMRCCVFLRPR